MSQKGLATALGVTMVFGAGLFAPPALAKVIINVVQDTNGVVATGSGTIDLAGLTIVSGFTASPEMNPWSDDRNLYLDVGQWRRR